MIVFIGTALGTFAAILTVHYFRVWRRRRRLKR
jgi:hypothetical protein